MTRTQLIDKKVKELAEKIKATNNGYLFAPTTEDVYIATTCPTKQFVIEYKPDVWSEFPFRIWNK